MASGRMSTHWYFVFRRSVASLATRDITGYLESVNCRLFSFSIGTSTWPTDFNKTPKSKVNAYRGFAPQKDLIEFIGLITNAS